MLILTEVQISDVKHSENCDILSRPVIIRHPDHYLSKYSKHSPDGDIGSVMEPVSLPNR